MSENKQLTSAKIDTELFEEFKVMIVKTKFSLQKLVERSMHLYVTNEEFRKKLHDHLDLSLNKE